METSAKKNMWMFAWTFKRMIAKIARHANLHTSSCAQKQRVVRTIATRAVYQVITIDIAKTAT